MSHIVAWEIYIMMIIGLSLYAGADIKAGVILG